MFAVEDRPLERLFRNWPITDRQKVTICLKLMRATQYNNRVLIRRCTRSLPALAQFFDSEGEFNPNYAASHKYLQDTCSDILHAEISDFFAEKILAPLNFAISSGFGPPDQEPTPGPDGAGYAAWKAGSELRHERLFSLQSDLLGCIEMKEGFNNTYTAFIPKDGYQGAGLFLLAIAAAFPSLDHDWIFDCSSELGAPRYPLLAISELYKNVATEVAIRGQVFDVACIPPMSGVIFALCADPLVRHLEEALGPHPGRPFAFADDVGALSQDLLAPAPSITRPMAEAAWATGLLINPKKCIIVFPGGPTKDEILHVFQGVGLNASPFQVPLEVAQSATDLGCDSSLSPLRPLHYTPRFVHPAHRLQKGFCLPAEEYLEHRLRVVREELAVARGQLSELLRAAAGLAAGPGVEREADGAEELTCAERAALNALVRRHLQEEGLAFAAAAMEGGPALGAEGVPLEGVSLRRLFRRGARERDLLRQRVEAEVREEQASLRRELDERGRHIADLVRAAAAQERLARLFAPNQAGFL
ncbi:unnamed protein product [Prorocentrum cordatum]|uniref:Reverse transcriptase domain-containing protein n=1 Tax=Prorocentrum cordatum TaxID=2364126 RepID=A0ABN9UBD5_9DINO|nr:unnamed protein product [Polarella glacialis]